MARIARADIDVLRVMLAPYDNDVNRTAYREGRFPRADVVKDVDRRYRWDILRHAESVQRRAFVEWNDAGTEGRITDSDAYNNVPVAAWVRARYDAGCNDTHIDTALKAIIPTLGKGK